MKERIFLCLLLATVSLLCSCSEQRYVPDSISSHAEITAKPRTTQPEKSTTLPGPEPQEKELTMIVNGMALDVSWEDNETVEELLVYAQNGTITVNTTICNGVQREHNKKLNNGLPILHKVPPKRDYGRYFCIMAEKGGTSHGGLTEKLSLFFHAKKQEVNAYGR